MQLRERSILNSEMADARAIFNSAVETSLLELERLGMSRVLSEAYNPEASNIPLCVKNHARVFLAGAAVQSEARKIILPKYGVREFKAKNFELATLMHVISTAERNRFVA